MRKVIGAFLMVMLSVSLVWAAYPEVSDVTNPAPPFIYHVRGLALAQYSKLIALSDVEQPWEMSKAESFLQGGIIEVKAKSKLRANVVYQVLKDAVIYANVPIGGLGTDQVSGNYVSITICKWPSTGHRDNAISGGTGVIPISTVMSFSDWRSFSFETIDAVDPGIYVVYVGFVSRTIKNQPNSKYLKAYGILSGKIGRVQFGPTDRIKEIKGIESGRDLDPGSGYFDDFKKRIDN